MHAKIVTVRLAVSERQIFFERLHRLVNTSPKGPAQVASRLSGLFAIKGSSSDATDPIRGHCRSVMDVGLRATWTGLQLWPVAELLTLLPSGCKENKRRHSMGRFYTAGQCRTRQSRTCEGSRPLRQHRSAPVASHSRETSRGQQKKASTQQDKSV